MSAIIDFKIINSERMGGRDALLKHIPTFNDTINDYLQKGYTLHGTTIKGGQSGDNYTYSQAVIKYAGATPGPVIKNYNLLWHSFDQFGSSYEPFQSVFEKNILDEIRNGYTLHGDLHYIYCIGRLGASHNFSQALVKISQLTVTFAEDLANMRANISKQSYSLDDFKDAVASHNRAISELRLDIDSQTKITQRQKSQLDELINPSKT